VKDSIIEDGKSASFSHRHHIQRWIISYMSKLIHLFWYLVVSGPHQIKVAWGISVRFAFRCAVRMQKTNSYGGAWILTRTPKVWVDD
jgi:hypothetical protein